MKTFANEIMIRMYKERDCTEAKKLRDGMMSHVQDGKSEMKASCQRYVDNTAPLYEDMDNLVHVENGGRMFVAVNAAKDVVGTAGLFLVDSDVEKKTAELIRMSVTSGIQGQGVGQRFLESCLDYAKNELKCESLHIGTMDAFVAANRLYKECGFALKGIYEIETSTKQVIRIIRYEKRLA